MLPKRRKESAGAPTVTAVALQLHRYAAGTGPPAKCPATRRRTAWAPVMLIPTISESSQPACSPGSTVTVEVLDPLPGTYALPGAHFGTKFRKPGYPPGASSSSGFGVEM